MYTAERFSSTYMLWLHGATSGRTGLAQNALGSVPFWRRALGAIPVAVTRLSHGRVSADANSHDRHLTVDVDVKSPFGGDSPFRSWRSNGLRTSFHIHARWTMRRKQHRRPTLVRRRRQAQVRDAEQRADHWRAHAGAWSSCTWGSGSTPRSGHLWSHCGGPSESCKLDREVGRHELRHLE